MKNRKRTVISTFVLVMLSLFSVAQPAKFLSKLQGTYQGFPEGKDGMVRENDMIRLLDRHLFSDTLGERHTERYDVAIDISTKNSLQILFSESGKTIAKRKYTYIMVNDSCLELQNENRKPQMVPFVFGWLDFQRLRFSLDADGHLEIARHHRKIGGIFFIPVGWKNERQVLLFRRKSV